MESCVMSAESWWIVSIPSAMASVVLLMLTFRPRTWISPLVGVTTPDRTFINVDLPAPLSPSRPTISPSPTLRKTSSRAWTWP